MSKERLAVDKIYLVDNLKMNVKEIMKRISELKELESIYNLELILRKSRKCFAFEILWNDTIKDG